MTPGARQGLPRQWPRPFPSDGRLGGPLCSGARVLALPRPAWDWKSAHGGRGVRGRAATCSPSGREGNRRWVGAGLRSRAAEPGGRRESRPRPPPPPVPALGPRSGAARGGPGDGAARGAGGARRWWRTVEKGGAAAGARATASRGQLARKPGWAGAACLVPELSVPPPTLPRERGRRESHLRGCLGRTRAAGRTGRPVVRGLGAAVPAAEQRGGQRPGSLPTDRRPGPS